MSKYYAAIKLKSQPTAYTMTFIESSVGEAIDRMLKIAGVSSSDEDVDEYELYQILDNKESAYLPVARKNRQISKPPERKVEEPKKYTEVVYTSYKDVA